MLLTPRCNPRYPYPFKEDLMKANGTSMSHGGLVVHPSNRLETEIAGIAMSPMENWLHRNIVRSVYITFDSLLIVSPLLKYH